LQANQEDPQREIDQHREIPAKYYEAKKRGSQKMARSSNKRTE